MAEFLITEAVDVDSVNDENNEGNINTATVSDEEFIDDEPQNESGNFYPYFTNVSRSYDDAMRDFENIDFKMKLVIILIVMKRKKKLTNLLILNQKLLCLKNRLLFRKV